MCEVFKELALGLGGGGEQGSLHPVNVVLQGSVSNSPRNLLYTNDFSGNNLSSSKLLINCLKILACCMTLRTTSMF